MASATSTTVKIKPEETNGVAVGLAACGGFLDAFTYLGHGHVFANAMSGNVVLLGVYAAGGDFVRALDYLSPILAFLAGVAVAEMLRLPRFLKWIPQAPFAALTLEIVFLGAAGFFPKELGSTFLVLGISFVAALQSSSFRRAGQWAYNSTVTTGNLRLSGEAFFQTLFAARDIRSSKKAAFYAALCLAFLVGAVFGGFCVLALADRALWVVDVMLLVPWFYLLTAIRSQSTDRASIN